MLCAKREYKTTMATSSHSAKDRTLPSGENLIPIGERNIFLSVSKWQGNNLIHIRKYKIEEEGDEKEKIIPTPKGIALQEEEFDKVLESAERIKKELRKTKRQPREERGDKKNSKKRKLSA